ncbi:hypothetical protein AGMMS49938_01370 [Fibrobacterales bacterium]|nr:hypothetical protein AGMMS49938_01370 [Fibrobacterales bacterium]
MKNKLCLASAAFFLSCFVLSCSDMGTSEAEVVEKELPKDFSRSVYAEINSDVPNSQIVFEVAKKIAENFPVNGLSDEAYKKDCAAFVADPDLAKEVYLNFVGCPRKGWNKFKDCAEQESVKQFAGNLKYTEHIYNKNADSTRCNIAGCYEGGWDEAIPFEECSGCKNTSLKDELTVIRVPDYLAGKNDIQIAAMCKFNLPQKTTPSAIEDRAFLNDFKYDSLLIERHYTMLGRYEGRPYKYCEAGKFGEERSRDMAIRYSQSQGNVFFDFGLHLFCLNKDDKKIYEVKE